MKLTLCLVGSVTCIVLNLILPSFSMKCLLILNQLERGKAHLGVEGLYEGLDWTEFPLIRTILESMGDSELYLQTLPNDLRPSDDKTEAILNVRSGYNGTERVISLIRAQMALFKNKKPFFKRVIAFVGREGTPMEDIQGYGEYFQKKCNLPQVLAVEDVKALLGDGSAKPIVDYVEKLNTVYENIQKMNFHNTTLQKDEMVAKLSQTIEDIRRDNTKAAKSKVELHKALNILKELMKQCTGDINSVVIFREDSDYKALVKFKGEIKSGKSIAFEGVMGTAGQGGFTIQEKAIAGFKVHKYLKDKKVKTVSGDASCGAGAEDIPEDQRSFIISAQEAIPITGIHGNEPQRRNLVICEQVQRSIEEIQTTDPDYGKQPEHGVYNVAIPRTDKNPEFINDALDSLLKLKAAFGAVQVPIKTVKIE